MFRLPDFRWLPNFPLFRDRQQRTSNNLYAQYTVPIADQQEWHRSQSNSGQYYPIPAYFRTLSFVLARSIVSWHHLNREVIDPSGHVDPRHGYISSSHPWWQANPSYRTHPSQFQGQHQPQQRQQAQLNQHLPNDHPQAQSQATRAGQPYYFHPNDNSNRNHRPYHRHRHHPQDDHDLRFPGVNMPFNHSQPYLTPQSVRPNADQAWTPFSNVSHVPSATSNSHRRRSHSQGSRHSQGSNASTSRAAPRQASSNAPHIRSRMLDLPLLHPLVCGHRHSLIPNQIPETEVGKSERSVWDRQQFSLPQGSQAPKMIDAVQVRSLRLDWDITLPPSFAKEIERDGQSFTPPRHIYLPLIQAKFNSEICIKTRQDNPLTKCFLRWGCIVVEPRDPNGTPPTMKQFLYDIWEYFHTSLTEEECLLFTVEDLAKLRQIVENRAENYAREGEQSPVIRRRGPTRRDVLWGYTRFAGLEVCPRFADTGDLFLYLEPL